MTQFETKIKATNMQKVLKLVLLNNYFFDLTFEVQTWYLKLLKLGQGCFFNKKSKFQVKCNCFQQLRLLIMV